MINSRMGQALRNGIDRYLAEVRAGHKPTITVPTNPEAITQLTKDQQEAALLIKQAGINLSEAGLALQTASKLITPFTPSVKADVESYHRWLQSRQQPPSDWRD